MEEELGILQSFTWAHSSQPAPTANQVDVGDILDFKPSQVTSQEQKINPAKPWEPRGW